MAKIKVTQVELDGGIAYTTDEEILRVADEIRKVREKPKFREGQIVEVGINGGWVLTRVGVNQTFEEGSYHDLPWIDKARIIAPPEAKWAAVCESGMCLFFRIQPYINGSFWRSQYPDPGFSTNFMVQSCENWKELIVEL